MILYQLTSSPRYTCAGVHSRPTRTTLKVLWSTSSIEESVYLYIARSQSTILYSSIYISLLFEVMSLSPYLTSHGISFCLLFEVCLYHFLSYLSISLSF